jgi:hypothetical protein
MGVPVAKNTFSKMHLRAQYQVSIACVASELTCAPHRLGSAKNNWSVPRTAGLAAASRSQETRGAPTCRKKAIVLWQAHATRRNSALSAHPQNCRHTGALGSPCFLDTRTPATRCQGLSQRGAGKVGCAASVPLSSHRSKADSKIPVGSKGTEQRQRAPSSSRVAVRRQRSIDELRSEPIQSRSRRLEAFYQCN